MKNHKLIHSRKNLWKCCCGGWAMISYLRKIAMESYLLHKKVKGESSVNTKLRNEKMVLLHSRGLTLQAIGNQFKVSRERVRQILFRYGIDTSVLSTAPAGTVSLVELSDQFGIGPNAIRRYLKTKGVKPFLFKSQQFFHLTDIPQIKRPDCEGCGKQLRAINRKWNFCKICITRKPGYWGGRRDIIRGYMKTYWKRIKAKNSEVYKRRLAYNRMWRNKKSNQFKNASRRKSGVLTTV